ncbi:MAG: hypothetical protein QXW77_03945, partial [Candidatus Hadarchaeales archaeon]
RFGGARLIVSRTAREHPCLGGSKISTSVFSSGRTSSTFAFRKMTFARFLWHLLSSAPTRADWRCGQTKFYCRVPCQVPLSEVGPTTMVHVPDIEFPETVPVKVAPPAHPSVI